MGCINFFTVTAKPRQQEKSPSYLLTPQNALSPVLSKLAKVKLRGSFSILSAWLMSYRAIMRA
jgi:hypothetical protein